MKAVDFDFSLPKLLIAKKPAEERDNSRLLVLHRDGEMEHKRFYNLPEYLNEGDMLLLNNTKVFPAKLKGIKPAGENIEFLLVKEISPDTWEILSKNKWSGRLSISEDFSAEIIEGRTAHFAYHGDFMENLWRYGDMPLPPYIKRPPGHMDKERYQTIYAEKQGSIAAPTAGLHFTDGLIHEIKKRGVDVRYITLHIGAGTFKPIKAHCVEEHSMDSEYFEIGEDIIAEIRKGKASDKKIIAVGTTTARAIEGYFSGCWSDANPPECRKDSDTMARGYTCPPLNSLPLESSKIICGFTDIFICPGYRFSIVDSLITNFHLPRSTPLMLTAALCGFKKMKEAYEMAVANEYRFYSYGDAMLVL